MMASSHQFEYGTAGFRCNATLLGPVIRRTAFFAALRSRDLGKPIGLMITASHNPICDNGVKLVEPDGGMLPQSCEEELTKLVNTTDQEFGQIKEREASKDTAEKAQVIIGTDTRPSSSQLLSEAIDEIGRMATVQKFEQITTPMLHSVVVYSDLDTVLAHHRDAHTRSVEVMMPTNNGPRSYTNELFVDCANGVGALWVSKYLAKVDFPAVQLRNVDTTSQLLNHECGADYVKLNSKLPANFDSVPLGSRCASLDGDADRVVYFYTTDNSNVVLLDGDHIAALFVKFIFEQFVAVEKALNLKFTLGVVQTAYANGNSTRFFNALGVKPLITKTGVKHLEEAARKFDAGIYFEANGHGSVSFSENFFAQMQKCREQYQWEELPVCLKRLMVFSSMINRQVGDGIADLLAVETLLRFYDWTVQDWLKNTYSDLPSVQKKVPVKDRSKYMVSDESEAILLNPEGMQTKIDTIVGEFVNARAFIRPSGTEQIVRIYAEADNMEQTTQLAERLAKLID